jgi:hypothetical protein
MEGMRGACASRIFVTSQIFPITLSFVQFLLVTPSNPALRYPRPAADGLWYISLPCIARAFAAL